MHAYKATSVASQCHYVLYLDIGLST